MGTNAKQSKRTVVQLGVVVGVAALIGLALWGYVAWANSAKLLSGEFSGAGGKSARFDFEVRHTCAGREEGLMFRKTENFPQSRAMIFVFSHPEVQHFWMRNTFIPLDMVFLDRDLTVRGILANVPPLTEDPRSIDAPSQFVVELNAGVAEKTGVKVGSKLALAAPLPAAEDCRMR